MTPAQSDFLPREISGAAAAEGPGWGRFEPMPPKEQPTSEGGRGPECEDCRCGNKRVRALRPQRRGTEEGARAKVGGCACGTTNEVLDPLSVGSPDQQLDKLKPLHPAAASSPAHDEVHTADHRGRIAARRRDPAEFSPGDRNATREPEIGLRTAWSVARWRPVDLAVGQVPVLRSGRPVRIGGTVPRPRGHRTVSAIGCVHERWAPVRRVRVRSTAEEVDLHGYAMALLRVGAIRCGAQ